MSTKWLTVEAVPTNWLLESDIRQIAEVEKDMWAYWIGEYVKCNCCQEIHSKNDIFWNLSSDIRKKTVIELENIYLWDNISCKKCESQNTDFIYGVDDNILDIRRRYYDSIDSCLSLAVNENSGTIVWFMDWYIDKLRTVYDRELDPYYNDDIYEILEKYILKVNWWKIPQKVLSFSSMWLLEEYKSFYQVFELIKKFFEWIDDKHNNVFWLTEVVNWSNLHWFHHCMWIQKLGINNYPWMDQLMANRSDEKENELFYQKEVVSVYKERYNLTVRQFIKKYRNVMSEILVA